MTLKQLEDELILMRYTYDLSDDTEVFISVNGLRIKRLSVQMGTQGQQGLLLQTHPNDLDPVP